MTSQELAEWMAYDEINAKAQEMITEGADARVAFEFAWKDQSDE